VKALAKIYLLPDDDLFPFRARRKLPIGLSRDYRYRGFCRFVNDDPHARA